MEQYITDSKQINLSSNSTTTSNYPKNSVMMFNLNNILKKEQDILYNLISVIHCEIPLSWYLINATNNILRIRINGLYTSYTLINGNYNSNTFTTMLLSILPSGFTLSLNTLNGKYILGYTQAFTINPPTTCGKIMGFLNNTAYGSDANFKILFPFCVNFMGTTRLKIKSNVIQTSNIDSQSKGRCNMLCSIPVNNSSGGLIVYNNFSQFKIIFPNNNLDYIDITISDENDNEIDFNGIDNYITLQIDSIRKHIPQINDLIHLLKSNENIPMEESELI